MTPDLVMHPATQLAVADYLASPAHAVMITGPAGSGKATIARYLAGRLLDIDSDQPEKLLNYPYLRMISPVDNKAIPIESIRALQQFLSLRIPDAGSAGIKRVIIIDDAHLLTVEAQNALLKTLEEPPADTVIILAAAGAESVLPTVQSRVRLLNVLPPAAASLIEYFSSRGYSQPLIERALLLSGELPGLASALLAEDTEHPLVAATARAREILQSKTYERLLLVDELSKQKQLSQDIAYVLGQMSRMALMRSTDRKAAERWQKILTASYAAGERLAGNSQSKLVLTNLMLEL